MTPPTQPAPDSRSVVLLRLALCFAIAVAFVPALRGGFVWDDHLLISNNAAWRSASGLWHALRGDFWHTSIDAGTASRYYRPIVSLAYFAQFQRFGLDPFGYHVVSFGLHVLCSLLALAWLRGRLAPPFAAMPLELGAFAGALCFALHPTRSESVSWISGCTDLWMTAFALAAALCARAARPWLRNALAPLLAAAALLCKEAAVVLPVLLALDAWLLAPPEARRPQLKSAAAVAGAVVLTTCVRIALVPLPASNLATMARQPVARVLSSFGHYLEASFVPLAPTVLRGKVAMSAHGELVYEPGSVALGALGCALLAIACVLAVRRHALRPWLADAAWFGIGLLPVLNVIPLDLKALVADRYLYLPLLGLCALLARATAGVWDRGRVPSRALLSVATAATAVGFVAIVWAQGRAFGSDEALWERELRLDPARAYVLESNASMSMNAGEYPRALALALAGMALAKDTGQLGPALRFTLLAAEAAARSTRDFDASRLIALRSFYDQLAERGEGALALDEVRVGERVLSPALALQVRLLPAQRQLLAGEVTGFALLRAELHARTADLDGARALLEAALRKAPRSPELLARLAAIHALGHRFGEAGAAAGRALQLAPASGYALGVVRAVQLASKLASQPADDARSRALRDAQIQLLFGAFGLARAELAAALAQTPDDLSLIALAARTDALDRRDDLARARIERAQQAHPEAAAQWSALLAELTTLRRLP